MDLVLDYESSALAAPQSFRDAMQTAANILDSTIQNNITVTIDIGYGDWDNGLITGLGTSAVGGDLYGSYVSYTTLRAALASHETSALDQTFVNSLPATSSVNGVSSFYVPSAVEKALGMISPTAPSIDGAVGIGTGIPTSDLVGVALHEFTHALGREPGAGTFDLTRYTSAGNHLFSSGSTAPAAYFSIDGGVTKLADYGQNSDPADFLNSGVQGANDPFNEFYSGSTTQSLSTVDKELLDALGFNVSTTAPSGPSATTSSLVASSSTVKADGTSTTTLTVTVKDASGAAVANTAVTLSASGSSNSFGTVSGTTDANGVFKTTLASTLAQNETITASEGGVQEQTSVSFVAGAASATTSSLVANAPTVTADGTTTTTLTVTVEDANGNAVAGTAVTLSGSGSANSFGAISGTTNANGVFTTTLASTLVQNETITATEGSVQEHASVSFVASAPSAATSSVVASSPTVAADGTSTTTLTVTVEDALGHAVAGTAVTLSGSGSANNFGAISGTTNANGVFSTTLASTLVQNETITATEGSTQEHTSVSFVAGTPSATTSSLVASSATGAANGTSTTTLPVTADGITTTTLTVTVEDALGHAVAGTAVTLSGNGSANSFGAISGTTDANGVFTTTLASTLAQNETITATEGGVQEQTMVSFVAGAASAATSSIVASLPTVTADGTTTTTLTVTVEDANGNAVAGTAVSLSGSGSANNFGAISGTTNANGVFTTTLASTLVQNETIIATEGSVQEHTSVSFVAGAASATTSSLVASSPTVTADGTSTTTLTVTVENALGHAVAGTAVILSGSGSSNSFGTISGTTDANGVFTTTLASTLVQNETITATEGSTQEHASVSFVAGAPSATTSSLVANSPTVTADGSSTTILTVTVEDALGHAVAGTAVTLSGSGSANSFGAISGTTNANGVFTSTLASTLVQNETITATEGSVQEHASVNFVPTATVIQTDGSTSLAQIGSNYYLYTNGSGSELKFVGSAYAAGEFGAWSPFAAVQTATGYDVAWKDGTGDYTVWNADSNGNWISDLISNVSASSSTLESIEATFHQDLNGDGLIGVPTIVTPSNTPTSVAQTGSNYYLYTNGSGPELKFGGAAYVAGEFGAWSPFAAVQTATGYDVAWKDGTGDYTVWNADSNGNWISDLISNVSASSSTLESIEATFHQDLNGDGLIGVPTIVTPSNTPTSVAQTGSNYYLYTNGSGPELKFVGSAYAAGEFGAWSPFAAVQTATGYDVAWKDGTGDYTVWSADSNGNWISDLISNVSASSSTLESIEATFNQDLNGDGLIGVPTIDTQPNAPTSVAQIGSNYFLYTNGSGPELKFVGSAYVAGEFGAWSPFAAVQTATGYDVAWKDGTGDYTVWSADSNGNWISDLISNVSASSSTLESIEATFHQDLNGDGLIGVSTTTLPVATDMVIEAFGSTSLVEAGNNFYLNEFTDLKFSGAAVVAGQFGAWAPIGAEQTATGYEVAWKAVGADQYTVWNTDSDGNFTSYAISAVSGSNTALESLETSFHQDLNGDGVIGIPPAATSPVASNNAGSNLVASGPVTTAAATSNDSFVFAPNFGHVTIANVAPLPDINFSHAVFANVNALLAAAHDDGHGNVIITDATHDTLTIQNMTSQQLYAHQSDFHIV